MNNIAPSRAIGRRARQFMLIGGVTAAGGFFALLIGIALRQIPLAAPESDIYGLYIITANALIIIGGIVLLVGIGIFIRASTWRRDNDPAKVTGEVLSRFLDNSYTLVRNVNQMGLGYIDAVLVGPPGTLVFRIIDREGIFLNEGDKWLKADRNNEWTPAGIKPTDETIVDIKALREYLQKRDIKDVPVFGVVVFLKSEPTVQITQKNTRIPAASLNKLVETLQPSYFAKERLDPATAATIIRLLNPV